MKAFESESFNFLGPTPLISDSIVRFVMGFKSAYYVRTIQVIVILIILLCNVLIAAAQNYKVNISYIEIGTFKDWNTGATIKSSICLELPLMENATLKWDYAFDTTLYAAGKLYFKNGRSCDVDGVYLNNPSSNSSLPALPNARVEPRIPPRTPQQVQEDLEIQRRVEEILSSKPSTPNEVIFENTQEAVNATEKAAYKVFPFLDVNNQKANYEAIEAVKARRDEYIIAGYNLSESLLNAVNDIGPLYDKKPKKKKKKPGKQN
jgi:hypothetical protein